VTITGAGFNGATSVKFETTDAISFTVDSNTQITAITPPGAVFTLVDVTVTDGEGSSTLSDAYIYTFDPSPSISTVVPGTGPVTGGTEVTISGPSVVGVTDVQFDGVSGTALEIVSATTLTVVTPAGLAGPADVTALGSGSSTIAGGFTYVNEGSFTDIGPGLGGLIGVPLLTGTGDLTPGSPTGFTLSTVNCFPLQPAILFVGLGQGAIPFKGGTFYPIPIVLQINLVVDVLGSVVLPAQIPAGTPGNLSLFFQTWVQDAFAPAGAAGSNGLKATTPP
jgi:hypothetical protein